MQGSLKRRGSTPDEEPTSKRAMATDMEIDENLHSRQLAVYGREVMKRMAGASVLIAGANGLGLEIGECVMRAASLILHDYLFTDPVLFMPAAKNVILAGVRAVTIQDQKSVELPDLSTCFYLGADDVGQNRAEACIEKLQELNTSVEVTASTSDLTPEFLAKFQV